MSTAVTWNTSSYSIPSSGEVSWSALSLFLIDLANNAQTTNTQIMGVRVALTTPVTISNTDFTVATKLTSPAAVAVTLPTGTNGRVFTIVDATGDAGTNNITVSGNGGQTINGATSYVINTNRGWVMVQFSTNAAINGWFVINASGAGGTNPSLPIRTATTSPVTVGAADYAVATKLAAPGAVAVSLPAGTDGRIVVLGDATGDAGTNNITITPNGVETINGAATYVINRNRGWVTLIYDADIPTWVVSSEDAKLLVNADVSASAAITYSKLALTGSIVNADISVSGAIVYSKLSLANSIVNADIGASAAIAYSKLNLSASIVNADIAVSAAIAYSKLNLALSIVNADISTSAAIVYSKLSLTGSILNADINASAAIAYSKLNLTGTILNADINASAAIAYSKLNLSASIATGDLAAALLVPVGKGGTGLTSGTSGGIPYYSGTTTLASSGLLAANGVLLGGGAGTTPTSTSAGSAYQPLRVPSGGGAPAFGALDLAQSAAITGTLALGNGGTGQVTANAALNALLPSQTGNASKLLSTDGSNTSWASAASSTLNQYNSDIGDSSNTRVATNTQLVGAVLAKTGSQTFTVTIAAPAVVTATSHGLSTGDKIYLTTTGALPTGLSINTTYFINYIDANSFRLCSSITNAAQNNAITTTGSQSGVHTLFNGGLLPSMDYIEVLVTSATTWPGADNAYTDLATLPLPPGDWDVTAVAQVVENTGTSVKNPLIGVSSTSGNSATGLTVGVNVFSLSYTINDSQQTTSIAMPNYRVVVAPSAAVNYYLKARLNYSGGTPQYRCRISGRRHGY